MKFDDSVFPSRRSVVMSQHGMAASSQPLAVEAAINVLRRGGNAIDAAVTANAVLSVIEPQSTGIGGDLFAIIWLEKEQRLVGLNASGQASNRSTLEHFRSLGHTRIPMEGALSITVPGALNGMAACLERHGTLSLEQALEPAIGFARDGFPVTEITAQMWKRASAKLSRNSESARVWLPGGRAPLAGEVFRNPELANSLRAIADDGPGLFYQGALATSICEGVAQAGGILDVADLRADAPLWLDPISTSYRGYDVFELPPNNQGLAVLIALNILETFPAGSFEQLGGDHLHAMIEAMTLAFADSNAYVGDPRESIDMSTLLSKSYVAKRAAEIDQNKPVVAKPGLSQNVSDTVYLTVVDESRNVVSMISSVFKAFGSGVTIPGTGIVMQNRGACFNLEEGHPNCLAPGKRPFHTIIPAMILRDGRPWASLGVVGGLMQAQAHLQVISHLVDFESNPQTALDAPRFRILEDGSVALENGLSEISRQDLARRGHRLATDQTEEGYGGGQIILLSNPTLFGGSDGRKDGCALGY